MRVEPDPKLIEMLQKTREYLGKPIKITSGVRCYAHNIAVGGSANSSHLRGYAADIQCETSDHRWKLVMGLMASGGFNRIGPKDKFVHVDMDYEKTHYRLWL